MVKSEEKSLAVIYMNFWIVYVSMEYHLLCLFEGLHLEFFYNILFILHTLEYP